MTNPTRRRGGRPKGSKNKRKLLSAASVQEICDSENFNPALRLLDIAEGRIDGYTKADALRATEKLFDAIHNKRQLPGMLQGGDLDGQYEIVFVEASDDFTLPGASNAKGDTPALQGEPIQRIGDSSPSW